jgi:hypothetical protein
MWHEISKGTGRGERPGAGAGLAWRDPKSSFLRKVDIPSKSSEVTSYAVVEDLRGTLFPGSGAQTMMLSNTDH